MVRKGSKNGLNTGNTIRQHPKKALLHQQQNYGYLTVHPQPNQQLQYSQIPHLHGISNLGDRSELSLNKQKRWELPENLRKTVQAEQDNMEIQITMMEHTFMPTSSPAMERWDTCDSYYSNLGNVRQCTSNTEMTVSSAKQGHRQQDHLSKLERRALKKSKKECCSTELSAGADEISIPSIEFHVTYGASSNGKLYKNIAKRPQLLGGKQKKQTPGCSKKFRSFDLERDDMNVCFDEDVEEYSEWESSSPVTASLADFLRSPTSHLENRFRGGKSHNVPTSAPCGKGRVHHIERSFCSSERPKSAASIPVYEPYTPEWCHISVQREEFDSLNMVANFGDKFREACCTPRIFTLDLSEELGCKNERFYLVMVFASAGEGVDTYRLYCAGDGVSPSTSRVTCVDSQRDYDVMSLKELVLCYARSIRTPRCVDGDKSRPGHQISGRQMTKKNVNSSTLSELVPRVVGEYHTRQYTDVNSSTSIFHMQRSMSCVLHCGVCFEELNGNILHSALLSCHHYFCNECWTAHINNCVHEGLALITCPEYECKKQVDAVFIMSLVEFSTYRLHEIHLTEFTLFSEQKANWCPSKGCGRILHCDDELAEKNEPITANCRCGTECCFKCLNEPHWPLSCRQLSLYHDKLRESRDGDLLTPNTVKLTLEVRTKACPKCHLMVAKDGGCEMISCTRCLTLFCWHCLSTQGYNHVCNRKIAKFKVTSFQRVTFIHNGEMAKISKHRLYKAKHYQLHLKGLCRNLICRTSSKRPLSINEGGEGQSLKRFFNQIVCQVVATHRLLEYCCITNCFKKGPKYCVSTITSLSYCLEAMERELASNFCNQKTLDKICSWYGHIKNNHRLLVHKMAALLSFATPVIE